MDDVPLLCSASPRRAALLKAARIAFDPGAPPDVDETPPLGVDALEVATVLAVRKARRAALRAPGRVVVCADTVVVADGAVLGKPSDAPDARRMLAALSGRAHVVATGVAVARDGRVESGVDRATVRFRPLTRSEIDEYVATGEPLDKAGAYAIQGGARSFVTSLTGRLDTVVGLPVPLVRTLLARIAAEPTGTASPSPSPSQALVDAAVGGRSTRGTRSRTARS